MVGFEPTVSGPPSRRIGQAFPHPDAERPGGFEPPHPPWQGGRLPGYIMDASSVPAAGFGPAAFRVSGGRSYRLSYAGVTQSQRWDSNPHPRFTKAVLGRSSYAGFSVPRPGGEPGFRSSEDRVTSASPPGQKPVPGVGFEPTFAGSEPAVLPLDHPGVSSRGGT